MGGIGGKLGRREVVKRLGELSKVVARFTMIRSTKTKLILSEK